MAGFDLPVRLAQPGREPLLIGDVGLHASEMKKFELRPEAWASFASRFLVSGLRRTLTAALRVFPWTKLLSDLRRLLDDSDPCPLADADGQPRISVERNMRLSDDLAIHADCAFFQLAVGFGG